MEYPYMDRKILTDFNKYINDTKTTLPNMFNIDEIMNTKLEPNSGYPHENIIETESSTIIEIALAGWKKRDIDVTLKENKLIVSGTVKEKKKKDEVNYIKKGIAKRSFIREYLLATFSVVKDCSITDGILSITVERQIPEEMKEKKITIK